MTNARGLRVVLVAATALVLAACGAPAHPWARTGGDDAVAGRAADGPDEKATRVRPAPGMVDLRTTTVAHYRVSKDGRTMTLEFWDSPSPCSELDHVEVRYGESRVGATVVVGRNPDVRVACPEIAVLKAVAVPLDEPLRGRRIDVAAP